MSLRERVRHGLLWSSAGTGLRYLAQLAISVVISRILSPTDYGLVAMVAAVQAMFIPISAIDVGSAIVRQESLSQRWLSTAFWLSIALGLSVLIVLCLAAPLIAAFYGHEELTTLTRATSLGFALTACGTVPYALLRREMRFKVIARSDVMGVAAGGALGIALALRGYGVWALIAQGLLGGAVPPIANWVASRFRPTLELDRAMARDLFRFGALMSGSDFVIMTGASAANALIGRTLGANDLGLYMRALNLVQLVVQTVTTIAQALLLPALAFVRQEPARFRSVCLRATGLAALVFSPALAAFVAVPDVVLMLLYGPKWSDAAAVLRVIALPYLAFGTTSAFTAIFPALSRVDLLFRWQALSGALLFAGAAIGSYVGTLEAVAYGQLALLLVIGPRIASAAALVEMKLLDYLRALSGPLLAGAATAVAVLIVRYALRDQPFAALASAVFVTGVVGYVGLAFAARLEAVRSVRQLLSR